MKIQLIKDKINPTEIPTQYRIEKLLLEENELKEKLFDYLTRFTVDTQDPDLIGVKPDRFINNMMNDKLGDFSKKYIITACINDQPVGILISLPKNEDIMHIFSVHVLPEYRKKGVASSMLIKCINDFYRENYSSILIDVHVDNIPAYKLYKKLGFIEC